MKSSLSLPMVVAAITVVWSVGPMPARAATCAAATTQFDLNRCAGQAFRTADANLNRSYAAAMSRLSDTAKTRLRDAQRAWIAFRDKQCAFESNGADGGSVAPMAAANCATGLTDTRVKALAQIGQCVEGDVSCAR